MTGMPMPDWYNEAKNSLEEVMADSSMTAPPPPDLEKVTDLPYLFAEYCVKGEDVLLHLFPRAGESDKWADGHYINCCRNCRAEVPVPRDPRAVKACPRCGHSGLIYIPGRSEEKAAAVSFPSNTRDLIKEAADTMWAGDIAVELVPEFGAYVVQFQKAKNTANLVGLELFVRKLCEPLNGVLAPKN